MVLELACPHFKSGSAVESFDVMVMRHLEDSTYSFAIDEFPEMTEDAIEELSNIKKIGGDAGSQMAASTTPAEMKTKTPKAKSTKKKKS